jgi:hypothetical protein
VEKVRKYISSSSLGVQSWEVEINFIGKKCSLKISYIEKYKDVRKYACLEIYAWLEKKE